MSIEEDTKSSDGCLPVAICILALCVTMLAACMFFIQPPWATRLAQRDINKLEREYGVLHGQAQQLFDISNQKQRFIDETFIHFARFLTNANVSEIQWSQGTISTVVDTNRYKQTFMVNIASGGTNVVVRKVKIPPQ